MGEPLVKATYALEGDGPLVFSCFERLQTVANACQVPHFRNVHAVAVVITAGDPTKNIAALEQEAKRSVESGIQWFLRKFNADLCKKLSAFKAARVMCPEAMQWLRPAPATVQGLRLFPFLDGNHEINGLITELPNYVAKAHNFTMACEEDKVNWWRQHSDRSPHWSFGRHEGYPCTTLICCCRKNIPNN